VKLDQQSPQDDIATRLRSLKGVQYNALSESDFVLTVDDAQRWNASIEQMKDFWPLIKEAYKRDDSELARQLAISFENVDKVFIKTKGSDIAGFCCIERHKQDSSVVILRDVIVQEQYQGSDIGENLYGALFSEDGAESVVSATTRPGTDINAVTSTTNTIPAIMHRFRAGARKGFDTYYGDMGDDDPEVERLRGLDTEYLRATNVLVQEAPEGHRGLAVVAENYIPPLRIEDAEKMEARAAQEGPGKEIFQALASQARTIIALQKTLDESKGAGSAVVAGHLVSMKRKADNR